MRKRFSGIHLAGGAVVLAFLVTIARFWHPVWGFTSFLLLDSSNDDVKIAAFKTYPVYVYRDNGGYDGLYYAQMAYHPTLRADELAGALDSYAYRGRRILLPAIAWLVALGRPAWIVYTYSALNIFLWLALAALAWRLLPVTDWRSWISWFGVVCACGVLASVRLALPDLLVLLLTAAALFAVEHARGTLGAAFIASAALAHETSVIGAAALFDRPWLSRDNIVRVGIAAVPIFVWVAYIAWSFDSRNPPLSNNLTWPLVGLFERFKADAKGIRELSDPIRAWAALGTTGALTAQAIYIVWHPRLQDAWWRLGAAYVLLLICFSTAVWEGLPGAAPRVALPLTLAFNILAIRRRERLVWLLAGNLSIVSGILMIREPPRDPREVFAASSGATAAIVRGTDGWTHITPGWRHAALSTDGRGELEIETWPHDDKAINVEMTLKSGGVRHLTVTQTPDLKVAPTSEAVLWRGLTSERPSHLSFPVRLSGGRARLLFDSPGEPLESRSPPPEAFALEDLQVDAGVR